MIIYKAIANDRNELSISRACRTLGVSRDAYYNWRKRKELKLNNDLAIKGKIEKIIAKTSGYGYRRVTKELQRQSLIINHKKVLRIMRKYHLIKRLKAKFMVTTDSNHSFQIYPNLIPTITLLTIDQLWVADITYIRLRDKFVYLAVILDAYSRRIIGWSLEDTLSRNLSITALRMALVKRNIRPGLIHHSDRGAQYACKDYTDLLKTNNIKISMSRAGNPYDNAKAESFMATIKKEEVNMFEYENMAEAKRRIGNFIEGLYNKKRLHSSIGYLPPIEFEENQDEILENNQLVLS